MSQRVSGKAVAFMMLGVIVVLIGLHITARTCFAAQACETSFPVLFNYGFYFDLNKEQNIPTWFSIFQLALTACLLAIGAFSAQGRGERALPWFGLTLIFLYIGLDEMTDFHGYWAPGDVPDLGFEFGHEGFNWVYGGLVVVAIVGLLYLRWLISIERTFRWQVILAGTVYVTGALFFEALGGIVADENFSSATYIVMSTFEESFELIGITIFLYAIITYFGRHGVQVRFD
ncbi:hypothetical protein ACMU_14395 [Actibacterium mucosum KCTC 23349]|uniref:Uncharacterized protein n=1 Tax=Actibacterium mucosum KCTC 23349 TaxID=1454373 RepID=A0A037ZFQ0_9RHOB|nr:hypothetical protein [Actibacterium mucosum]KAJ54948.1 hypothetical protein ACMU_14395 [Actibacterium mucosum KCTC 23349]